MRSSKALLFLLALLTHLSLPMSSPLPQPPLPAPPAAAAHGAARVRQIAAGVLLGSLAGVSAAVLVLLAIRAAVVFFNLAPSINGGPVTSFSPRIRPKPLALALSTQCHPGNLLGSGATGRYYKVAVDDKLVVAVKCLEPVCGNAPQTPRSKSAIRRARKELELLAGVDHKNVMSLRAYAIDHGRLSLVYDLVGGGSLTDAMEGAAAGRVRIGWEARFGIAVGVAKGLRHLHFECSPRVLHCGLKPGNVLLSEEFEPMLSDCGLARVVSGNGGGGGGDPKGSSVCYVAPECLLGSRYTDKSDVFSFGVILAVLLTGRDPSDPFFSDEESGRGSLGRWLGHLQQAGEAREALDEAIVSGSDEAEEEEMLMAVRVALCCLSELPADRPSSDELVAMLSQLRSF